ncbi:ribosome biogenesis GTP-binding protein YihA/YsxC [Myxococcota bacterium]|nr:ribosome biogenesis GTP-binding protein YihA/YsxC [Myxococcota bacterium]
MRTRFITSAAAPSGFPKTDLAEVAFLGRSNVGKSSLLNAIAAAKIARTSRTPGRTQLVNFFEIHTKTHDYVLADLPGLGYANVPREIRAGWRALIDGYLTRREPLRALLWLVDLRRDILPEDAALHADLVETLSPRGVEVLLVGTKADKLAKAAVKPTLRTLTAALGVPYETAIATSTLRGLGIDALRAKIATLV